MCYTHSPLGWNIFIFKFRLFVMGIVTKEVLVEVGNQAKYYESKGYFIERNKKGRMPNKYKILVKVADLQKHSRIKIKVKCDFCGIEKELEYGSYTRRACKETEYSCYKCTIKYFYRSENSPFWKKNLTEEDRIERRLLKGYVEFRTSVFLRDNYTCRKCGKSHTELVVHHLDGYDNNKDKRLDVRNGITLCEKCHIDFHSRYGRGNNTKTQFCDWLGIENLELEDYEYTCTEERKIICYETKEIYLSANEAAKKLNLNAGNIRAVCKRYSPNRKYKCKNGKTIFIQSSTKTIKGLHFFYLEEYEKLSDTEIQNIIETKNKRNKKVRCISTGEIFESTRAAAKKYNVSRDAIERRCKGTIKRKLKTIPELWEFI